jgi:two-component system, chemotaxis family, CheB/CheR fusion protein
MAVDRVPIALVDLLGQAVNSAMPFVEKRGHRLTAMLPDAQVTVCGDGTRLEQVFGNLLNNAAKYTDRGGHIVLGLSVVDSEAVVTVSDDGAGIEPTILPHVFDLFVQSEATRSRAQGGLGIGLTLVRQIVEIHGGSVRATSGGSGQGSVFTVRLPLIQATVEEAQSDSVHAADMANFRPCRVLVVDDNIDSANSIGELIRTWGHEVALAYDGFVGIEVARTFVPDVALLDIGLPTMDGYVLAGELRKLQADGLFLIAMTGYGQEADRNAARQAGFDVHLVKPVGVGPLQTLLATLQK